MREAFAILQALFRHAAGQGGSHASVHAGWRLCLLLALALAAASGSQPSIAQSQPKPARIISLVPAVTEMVFALGAGDRVVGVSSFDRFPPEVARIPRVGALLDPDVERILSMQPDLVIAYRSQRDLLTQLSRARIATFVYAHAGLADVTVTMRQLGERIGAADRARVLADEINRRVAEVRRLAAGRPHPRTLVVFGRDAFALRGIYASGGTGFIHDMLTAAGGRNVFADTHREAVQASTELIIARTPEVILELRADPVDATTESRELETWRALSSVPAVRQGRVHIIADPRTVIPGPRVAEGVELIARVLQGSR